MHQKPFNLFLKRGSLLLHFLIVSYCCFAVLKTAGCSPKQNRKHAEYYLSETIFHKQFGAKAVYLDQHIFTTDQSMLQFLKYRHCTLERITENHWKYEMKHPATYLDFKYLQTEKRHDTPLIKTLITNLSNLASYKNIFFSVRYYSTNNRLVGTKKLYLKNAISSGEAVHILDKIPPDWPAITYANYRLIAVEPF